MKNIVGLGLDRITDHKTILGSTSLVRLAWLLHGLLPRACQSSTLCRLSSRSATTLLLRFSPWRLLPFELQPLLMNT